MNGYLIDYAIEPLEQAEVGPGTLAAIKLILQSAMDGVDMMPVVLADTVPPIE